MAMEVKPRAIKKSRSYYDFHGTPHDSVPNATTWMYASEARAQQQGVIEHECRDFWNAENLPLRTPGRCSARGKQIWKYRCLIPGTDRTWKEADLSKGRIRSVWTAGDPMDFDIVYHDINSGRSRSGNFNFSVATYHKGVPSKAPEQKKPSGIFQPGLAAIGLAAEAGWSALGRAWTRVRGHERGHEAGNARDPQTPSADHPRNKR